MFKVLGKKVTYNKNRDHTNSNPRNSPKRHQNNGTTASLWLDRSILGWGAPYLPAKRKSVPIKKHPHISMHSCIS